MSVAGCFQTKIFCKADWFNLNSLTRHMSKNNIRSRQFYDFSFDNWINFARMASLFRWNDAIVGIFIKSQSMSFFSTFSILFFVLVIQAFSNDVCIWNIFILALKRLQKARDAEKEIHYRALNHRDGREIQIKDMVCNSSHKTNRTGTTSREQWG